MCYSITALKIQLTEKTCACGCGKTFKVYPDDSPCIFYNLNHAHKTLNPKHYYTDDVREKAKKLLKIHDYKKVKSRNMKEFDPCFVPRSWEN